MLEDLAENEQEERKGKVRDVLEGIRPGFQGRHRRRILPTASASPSCCGSSTTHADSDEQTVSLADYIARMKEGQEKIYYVTADTFAGREEQPASGNVPQEGHRSTVAVRARGRMAGRESDTNSKASRCNRSPRAELDLGKLEDEAEKKEQEKEADEYKELTEKIKKRSARA